MQENLELKSDEELIAIYASEYPCPLDLKDIKKLLKNSPELYKEMEKRRLFVNLKYIVSPEIRKEYQRIQKEDRKREKEGRESIIKRYDLSLDKFAKIMTERKSGIKLKTKEEFVEDNIIKILLDMENNRIFEEIGELKEYDILYRFRLVPLKMMLLDKRIDKEDLRKTAESLKNLENKEGYEVIKKLKGHMEKIYNEVKNSVQ